MRIIAQTLSYPPDRFIGAELAMHRLLKHLQARGHHVSVETTDVALRHTFDGVQVAPGRISRPDSADAVLVQAGLAAAAKKRFFSTPMWVYAHNARLHTLLDVRTAHNTGACEVIANTQHMAEVFQTVIDVRSHVLYPPAGEVTGRLHRGRKVGLINLSHDKGVERFYELAEAMPDTQFIGLTGGYGGQVCRDMPNVTLLPHGDTDAFWKDCGVLLVPSIHESFGMVAVEAHQRRVPTLTTDTPGLREATGKGGVHLRYDAGVDAWKEALSGILTDMTRWRARAAENAHHIHSQTMVQLDALTTAIEGAS